MSITLNIFILLLTAILVFIPFSGDLWIKKKKKIKIYKKGIFFITLSVLTLFLGIIQAIKESDEQESRDKQQNNTFSNSVKILSKVDSSINIIEKKLVRIDSLSIKLDTIEIKAISSIDKLDNTLDNFDRIDKLLNKRLNNLSYPLPNELKITGLSFTIQSEGLKKFIPELRNRFFVDDVQGDYIKKVGHGETGYLLYYGRYNPELQNLFDGKILLVKFSLGDDIMLEEETFKPKLNWAFRTKLSLRGENSNFYYNITKYMTKIEICSY